MPAVPAAEIEQRIRSLQERLAGVEPPLDAAIVVQSTDLFYLAGTIQTSHLVVPRQGPPRLLVRKVLERARDDSPLRDIRSMTSLRSLPAELRAACGPSPWRLGMELDVLPVNLAASYRRLFGSGVEIVDVSPHILALRAVKSPWEVEEIRRSAAINDALYRRLPDLLRPGVSSYELQARLDTAARIAGHVGVVRMRGFNVDGLIGVVVSGPAGAMPGHSQFPIGGAGPHPVVAHGGDCGRIERGVPVTFDYLANAGGYHHDQTRMAVVGEMPREAMGILDAMQAVLRRLEKMLRPGAKPADLYGAALEEVAARGLSDGFLGPPGYAVPFVGHAIGLEVNEAPVLAQRFEAPLVAGNVLAIEPKFTHPELGVIGLENTYCISSEGADDLGLSPEDVLVVP